MCFFPWLSLLLSRFVPPHEPQPACLPNPDLKPLPPGSQTKPTLRSLLADLQRKLPCVRFSMTGDAMDWVEQPIPATAWPTAPQTHSQLRDRVLPAVLLNGKESDLRLGWRLSTDDRAQYQLYVEQKPLLPKPQTSSQTLKNQRAELRAERGSQAILRILIVMRPSPLPLVGGLQVFYRTSGRSAVLRPESRRLARQLIRQLLRRDSYQRSKPQQASVPHQS